jgi:hypothetical protein
MDDFFDSLSNPSKPSVQKFNGQFDPIVTFDQFNTPHIPADLLPPVLGNVVQNISDVLHVPFAMPFMASLGMVSAAVGKKFIVSPKPDWQEPINIYCLVAMPPASNKSQTLKYLKSPVDEWEEREAKRIAPQRDAALTELKLLQVEVGKYYKTLKKAGAKQADIDTAKERVPELEKEIQEKKEAVPVAPVIYTTDATPEAIADLVHEQGNRLAIISDEGGITEVLSGLYNSGNANIDIILKGIDGGTTRIKRANKDYRLNPYLTVLLMVQPQILTNMAEKRAFTGNGALERYLYAIPCGNVGYRVFDNAKVDEYAQRLFSNLIINLLSIPVPDVPHVLELDFPSRDMFHNFRQEIERELRPDGKLFACRGWGGKLAGYTLRLAGLMHVAEHGNASHLIIQKATMEKAVTVARLLMEHAVAAYNMMGADPETNDAKELLEWLKTKKVDRLTKTDIIKAMHNRKMGKKDRLAKALGVLVDRNILSVPHTDNTTRKPKDVYFINPDIYL